MEKLMQLMETPISSNKKAEVLSFLFLEKIRDTGVELPLPDSFEYKGFQKDLEEIFLELEPVYSFGIYMGVFPLYLKSFCSLVEEFPISEEVLERVYEDIDFPLEKKKGYSSFVEDTVSYFRLLTKEDGKFNVGSPSVKNIFDWLKNKRLQGI